MDACQAMSWLQIMALIFGNVAWVLPLWLWSRAENRADQRQMMSIVEAIRTDAKTFQTVMAQESKDFHGRLCTIEERGRQ